MHKGEKFKYLAEKYYGGDGPIKYIFDNEEDRDEFVSRNNYCNAAGKVWESNIYDEGGNHWGIFIKKVNGKFIDLELGIEHEMDF